MSVKMTHKQIPNHYVKAKLSNAHLQPQVRKAETSRSLGLVVQQA